MISDQDDISPDSLRALLQANFPAQNNYYQHDYIEEVCELAIFGITKVSDLKHLLDKHKGKVVEIDAQPLDPGSPAVYVEELGEEVVREREENGYFFALPALLRLGLEVEFGKRYEDYINSISEE